MYSEDQVRVAESFLSSAVSSGVLSDEVCRKMVNRIKSQDEVLLSYKEVESRLGISRSTIDRMAARKELRKVKINGFVRITKSSVDQVIESVIAESVD